MPWEPGRGVTVVGCPVYERKWVLDKWFDALADWAAHIELEFAFVYTPSSDGTLDVLTDRSLELSGKVPHIIIHEEGTHSKQRNWGDAERLRTMASMRNLLLKHVRLRKPDWYFSLDSDILVPSWLEGGMLWEALSPKWHYGAVAPLAYLGRGSITNAFTLDKHRRQRAKVFDAIQPVKIICAAKLMSPHVFMDERVNYGYHTHGEDLYWSQAAVSYSHNLAIDTRVKCKHVMSVDELETQDRRIGW